MSPPAPILPRLVLFDIDGTLVLTGGAGARAMTLALRDLLGVENGFDGIPMPGRTDQIILLDALERGGHPNEPGLLEEFQGRYLAHLAREIDHPAPGKFKGIMPGVRELLDALQARDDVFLALLTGNYQAAAKIKLKTFDLWRYFRCGAFGEDAHDRNDLVPVAVRRARECGLPEIAPGQVVVIGDTPLDVACAKAADARAIAVATGGVDEDTLRASGADVVFTDLGDTDRVLEAVLERGSPIR
jgi:phosphoglycolate phosphatase-like HAD superfamily hydrolase